MPAAQSHTGFDRREMLRRLEDETFDVLVIGGGITGVGAALDAASRGLRTALVERDDFAAGTSSKSSKLVHGGLRYLQDDPRLVYEALRERKRLRSNAPHLVKVLPFMLPVLTKDGVVSRKIARALGSALWMYDLTGGWRIGKFHKRLRKNAAFKHLPTMPKDRLASAYLYYDATADDARLVVTVARTAAAHGAAIANRCSVVELSKSSAGHAAQGQVDGAVVEADGRRFTIRASVVVNACGVWSDDVRALDEGTHPDSIRPAKGVHITVPWEKVRNDVAVVIPVPKDKRSLFVVPWVPLADGTFRHTYVGTTDTDYDGPLIDPQCTKDDIDYVLRALNASVTTNITEADITGVWAGLRPLVKAATSGRTADLSRHHKVRVSESGVVTVTGGKLTTYREMAEDAIDTAVRRLGMRARCRTRNLPLVGAIGFVDQPAGTAEAHLADRYGGFADEITALIFGDPSLAEPLVPGLPYTRAEAIYAVRHEMALTLDDVLTRRTRARLIDRAAALRAAPSVAALLATELNWDAAEVKRQVDHFEAQCAAEASSAASPAALSVTA
ncbi:MAG: glycerol-3-phosphate dehydrogenase/oxidase [Actinomycetia bacterium]|nr:glycerol-3-phosphate dehydrogenase/oxidase [Actinomycetes bacterium]